MYIPHSVDLSVLQRKKLLRGLPVQLKHANLTGGMVVMLDPEQARRYKIAKRNGKGLRVHFRSPIQIDHNLMHGKGFKETLTKIRKFGQKHIVPVFKKHAQKFAHEYAPKIGNRLKEMANETIDAQDLEGMFGQDLGRDLKKMAKHHANEAISKNQRRVLRKADEHLGGYEDLYEPVHETVAETEGGRITQKSVNKAFRNVGRVLKNKLAKPLLKGIVDTALPAALGGLTAEMGGVGAIAAPLISNVANRAIDGLGAKGRRKKGGRKMKIGLTGKALLG